MTNKEGIKKFNKTLYDMLKEDQEPHYKKPMTYNEYVKEFC